MEVTHGLDDAAKSEAGPSAVFVACLIVAAILLAFWLGYRLGLEIGAGIFG
jgi:hypothetical protein